jgi:hypothetical protein
MSGTTTELSIAIQRQDQSILSGPGAVGLTRTGKATSVQAQIEQRQKRLRPANPASSLLEIHSRRPVLPHWAGAENQHSEQLTTPSRAC